MFTNIFAPLTERAVSYLIYEHDSLSLSLFETEGGLTRSLTVVEYNNEITTRIIVRAALTPSFFDWTGKMKRWGEVKSLGKLLGWDFLSILRYLVHRRFNTKRIVDIYIYISNTISTKKITRLPLRLFSNGPSFNLRRIRKFTRFSRNSSIAV